MTSISILALVRPGVELEPGLSSTSNGFEVELRSSLELEVGAH